MSDESTDEEIEEMDPDLLDEDMGEEIEIDLESDDLAEDEDDDDDSACTPPVIHSYADSLAALHASAHAIGHGPPVILLDDIQQSGLLAERRPRRQQPAHLPPPA